MQLFQFTIFFFRTYNKYKILDGNEKVQIMILQQKDNSLKNYFSELTLDEINSSPNGFFGKQIYRLLIASHFCKYIRWLRSYSDTLSVFTTYRILMMNTEYSSYLIYYHTLYLYNTSKSSCKPTNGVII